MAITVKSLIHPLWTHRHWEDGLSFVLGILVIASPWVFGPVEMYVVLNTLIVGLLICGLSALEAEAFQQWEEWFNFVLGIWLVISPWLLGYGSADSLATSHYGLGVLVAGLAAFEYWQDSHRAKTAR